MASRLVFALLISAALSASSQNPNAPQSPTGEPPRPGAPPPGGWPDKSDKPDKHDWGHHGPPPPLGKPGPEGEAERDRAMRELQKLSPEQRERIWKVVIAVLNSPEEKRIDFLSNEDERRSKIREQIEQAIKMIGVPIPDDRKRSFFHKYFEGRRAIEERIRKEDEEKRQSYIGQFHEELKKEFGAPQPPDNQKAPPPQAPPK